jgi:hypothetical protein
MKAFGKLKKSLQGGDVEGETARATAPEMKGPIVKLKHQQARKHKVISYGQRVLVDDDVPEMYRFQYQPDPQQPEDLHPGVIPVGFSAGVPVADNMIYFYTREGISGPEYSCLYERAAWNEGQEGYRMSKDFSDDVDTLWVMALHQLEEDNELDEDDLAFLDADPLWLFGIADPATQRTLERTSQHPMLRCQGQRPCIEEWFAYLNADEKADADYRWVVESFAEVELPQPYTSFKGVGNVVCYLNNETDETDWQHPFYPYFKKLLDLCRMSTHEEHIKMRIERILYTYTAESSVDVQRQMPLVSPKYVKQLGDILSVNLQDEPFMVRTLKTFLRAFSQMCHEGELDTQEVKWCLEIVQNERKKVDVAQRMPYEDDPADQLDSPQPGQLLCIECGLVATCFCPDCGDCMCELCFQKLHGRGNRTLHVQNNFVICTMCKIMPAKLQCTYTRGKYCIECYTKKHAKTLPKFLDLKPLKIDYRKSKREPLTGAAAAAASMSPLIPEDQDSFSKSAPLETTLGEKWHAFYDLRGVKYYYNFQTQESLRRPQNELISEPAEEDAEIEAMKNEIVTFLAKSREPRLLEAWREGCDDPTLKPIQDDEGRYD